MLWGIFFSPFCCCCDWGNCKELFISFCSFSAFAHLLTAYSLASAILFANTFMHMYNFISCVIAKSSLFSTDCYTLLFIHLHIKINIFIVQQAEATFLWSQHEAMVMNVLSGVVYHYVALVYWISAICCLYCLLLSHSSYKDCVKLLFVCLGVCLGVWTFICCLLINFVIFFIVTISCLFSIFKFLFF